jgi:hypothetical protein
VVLEVETGRLRLDPIRSLNPTAQLPFGFDVSVLGENEYLKGGARVLSLRDAKIDLARAAKLLAVTWVDRHVAETRSLRNSPD